MCIGGTTHRLWLPAEPINPMPYRVKRSCICISSAAFVDASECNSKHRTEIRGGGKQKSSQTLQ
jgi:hypothetical protein